jgi:hypothetical protein
MWGISWPAEDLLASLEGFCSMTLAARTAPSLPIRQLTIYWQVHMWKKWHTCMTHDREICLEKWTFTAVGQVSCNRTWLSTVLQWIRKSIMSRSKTGSGGYSWGGSTCAVYVVVFGCEILHKGQLPWHRFDVLGVINCKHCSLLLYGAVFGRYQIKFICWIYQYVPLDVTANTRFLPLNILYIYY